MSASPEREKRNFVSCVTWVKRGVAKAEPDKVRLSEGELSQLIQESKKAGGDVDDEDSDGSDRDEESEPNDVEPVKIRTEADDGDQDEMEAEYGFKNYDEDEGRADIVGGIAGLTVYASNKEDPYVTIPDDSDDDSEKADDIIKPNDNLILVGHVESDQAVLEVYVQNEEEGSLYVHHELALPFLPLCLEWLSYDPSSPTDSNLCAVGGLDPVIHVMDIDIVDCLEPAYILGSTDYESQDPLAVQFKKKRKKLKKKREHIGHKDPVLALSWNTNYTHVLASGSVDETAILWDLETGSVNTTLDPFREKVQTLNWHPFEGQTLLTGCTDQIVRVFDCRSKDSYKSWALSGGVENVIWDHFNPFCFLASTEKGKVFYVDCRNEKPAWELAAHPAEVTGLALSCSSPGLLYSSCSDGCIKVWDIEDRTKPVFVWEYDSKLGHLLCLSASPDNPFTVAAGGDYKSLNFGVWDLSENSAVRERFSKRPLLIPVRTESSGESEEAKPHAKKTVMETVASAMDDLCLSLSAKADSNDSKLKKLPEHSKVIKKNKNKKKKIKQDVSVQQ